MVFTLSPAITLFGRDEELVLTDPLVRLNPTQQQIRGPSFEPWVVGTQPTPAVHPSLPGRSINGYLWKSEEGKLWYLVTLAKGLMVSILILLLNSMFFLNFTYLRFLLHCNPFGSTYFTSVSFFLTKQPAGG